jgi:hypothetical protein
MQKQQSAKQRDTKTDTSFYPCTDTILSRRSFERAAKPLLETLLVDRKDAVDLQSILLKVRCPQVAA